MCAEADIHQDPKFVRLKTDYFVAFARRHKPEWAQFVDRGLLAPRHTERSWRGVVRHQLLSAAMAETMGELLGLPPETIDSLTRHSLTHDIDKKDQNERMTREEIMAEEFEKGGYLVRATGTNFRGFDQWDTLEYILRYVDSSVGDKEGTAHILPWRERVADLRRRKADEDAIGQDAYGMGTWGKLEQIMGVVERKLHADILARNPSLAARYPDSSFLTQLVEDQLHQKILSPGSK